MKKAFLPEDGSPTMTFNTEDEVLEYLGNKVRSHITLLRSAGGGAGAPRPPNKCRVNK